MTITNKVKDFLDNNPYYLQALGLGVVNYSKLARTIAHHYDISNTDGIIAACRRYKPTVMDYTLIQDILRQTRLSVFTRRVVIILDSHISSQTISHIHQHIQEDQVHVVRGTNAVTLILPTEHRNFISEMCKNQIIKIHDHLVEVVLESSTRLEEVPGVMAYLYTLLSSQGINVVETLSCWTDTILLIDKEYLETTMRLLSFDDTRC